jgi:uncharacterized membrane protein
VPCGLSPDYQTMRWPQIFRCSGVLLGLGLLWPLGCDDQSETPAAVCPILSSNCPAVVPSYANEVAPILAAHCGQCHTRENLSPTAPWPLDDPTDVADWASTIQADIGDCLMPPPEADAPLNDVDRDTLHVWLLCGAPLN